MSMPPGVPEDPHAPPTAPMYPVQPQYQPPQPPQAPPAPQYSAPQYEPPTAPAAPQYPGGAPEYPGGGYAAPPQSAAPTYPGAMGDALVLPPGSSFNAWFAKVQEVAKRSWKSALFIAGFGIAVPYGIAGLVGRLGSWGLGLSLFAIGDFFTSIGALILGWFLAFVVAIAGCFVAAAGWAGGTWALVHEAAGQRPSIGAAFSYGFKRAMALFPWTVITAVAYGFLASCCFWIPGLYLAFAFSMFGFVGVFERGQNPIGRSVSLTHNSATFGPTAGKVGILLAVGSAYYWLVNFLEFALSFIANLATFGSFTYNLLTGFVELLGGILMAPLFAMLLIGLLPTYAELRARQQPLSTAQLQQELG